MVNSRADTGNASSVQVAVRYSVAGPSIASYVPATAVSVGLIFVDVFVRSRIDAASVRIGYAFTHFRLIGSNPDAAGEGVVSDACDLLATVDDDRIRPARSLGEC